MYIGAQFSLYPMTDDFVGVIIKALSALDPYRDRLQVETDDVSTLLVGPPEALFPAMRDLFAATAATGKHCVLSATISRGCPGEPDDPRCHSPALDATISKSDRIPAALDAIAAAPQLSVHTVAQFSLYLLGAQQHMDEIEACIDLCRQSGLKAAPKHFCTKLAGDAGPVFALLEQSFCRFGAPDGHVAIDLTVSANSPSLA
ncbi:hypothetical protein GCM10007989_22570 [Devosia pacifica]|uniref:Thiamin/hydroxymethyl pyrimidine-binding YkoF putative domain-containing protein n=1 Tax=Devosia pacifica TaxID=1335967 RepID=A0A918VUT6_9HYPH|nr:YkoF family thiamine/hydroxymethylpyrimidine-binding protein [Devosia pacifica]GHA26283.1 hypothetical protein GCM10007989_22570 [Devosia pacifica]